MQGYFSAEIKRLKNELTTLKTSSTKSSGSIMTISKSIPFQIQLESTGAMRPSGRTNFVFTSNGDALFSATLDSYYDDVMEELDGRYLTRQKYVVIAERFGKIRVDVRGVGTRDDEATIRGGGSVSLTGLLTIKCTNDFTIEAA